MVAGRALTPMVKAGAAVKGDRLLHARGTTYPAEVTALAASGAAGELAGRLAGPALVRFSTALWRTRPWPDLLGCALRLGAGGPGEQDLLFSTARHVFTLAGALFTTRRDFLDNDYYALAPFRAPGLRRVELRLVAAHPRVVARGRFGRLDQAVRKGSALLRMDLSAGRWGAWEPMAEIQVGAPPAGEALPTLRADPFRAGKGLEPVGFLNALRRAAYGASREAPDGSAKRVRPT